MRSLATLAAACAALALLPTASGQTFEVVGTSVAVSSERSGGDTIIENFDKDAVSFFNYTFGADGPPVFGPNANYNIIASGFESGGSSVATGADIYFSFVSDEGTAAENYTVEIYGGTADSGPTGGALASQTFAFADIQQDPDNAVPTTVLFDTPADIGDYFYVVVDFSASGDVGDANVGATEDLDTPNLPSWVFFNGAWSTVESLLNSGGNPLEAYLWIDGRVMGGVAAEELPEAVTSVTAFPNPVVSSATLAIELASATEVRAALYDVLGRQVAQIEDGLLPAGRTALAIDAASFAPGTYVARIEVDGAVVTRQLTVVR